MSFQPDLVWAVPERTAEVAHAAFPQGNRYMQMRDTLGTLYTKAQFADLYPHIEQPAEHSWRLALVTIMQFTEHLPDHQADEAVLERLIGSMRQGGN